MAGLFVAPYALPSERPTPGRPFALNLLPPAKMSQNHSSPSRPLRSKSLATLLKDSALSAVLVVVVPFLAVSGRLTLFVAREKFGKSTFLRAAAAAVSRGAKFLGQPTIQGPVLWMVLEELLADAVFKLQKFDPDLENSFLLQASLERRFEELKQEVAALRPRLLVIDTLASYAEGEDADENSSMAWTRLLNQLRRLAEEFDVAVVLLHHATKRDGGYRGSSAIGASVDQIVEMHEASASNERSFTCKGRWEIPDYRVRFDKDASKFEFLGPVLERTDDTVSTAAKRRMRDWLSSHPNSGKTDITAQAGCRAADARVYFDELLRDGVIIASDKGYALAAIDRAA